MHTASPNQAIGDERTVLIVDDEPAVRALLRDVLAELPVRCRVYEAENGDQAVKLAQATPMDLILLDIILPGSSMQGVMVCRELCRDIRSKVVIVSGAVNSAIAEACLAMGAAGILHKPVSVAQLAECVTEWLAEPAPVG